MPPNPNNPEGSASPEAFDPSKAQPTPTFGHGATSPMPEALRAEQAAVKAEAPAPEDDQLRWTGGTQVTVKRSDGSFETDWHTHRRDGDHILVVKYGPDGKTLADKSLLVTD